MKQFLSVLMVLAIGTVIAGCPAGETTSSSTSVEAQPAPEPQLTADGLQDTQETWPAESTRLIERTKAMGFPELGDESFHLHALLTVFVNGVTVPVPANIGLSQVDQYLSPLHTHAPDNVIHVEADNPFDFTIDMIFRTWGVVLTPDQLGGYKAEGENTVHILVNGEEATEGLDHVIKTQDNIVVAFGTSDSFTALPSAANLEGQP